MLSNFFVRTAEQLNCLLNRPREFDSVCLEGIIQVALRSTPSGILGVLEKVCFIKLWQQRVTVSKGSLAASGTNIDTAPL